MNDDEDEDVEGDMTPMIDIIFLLLIFFLLTTKFIPEEKVIASILPTDKGQAQSRPQDIEPPQDVNVLIYPYDPNNPSAYARGAGGVQYFHNLWNSNPAKNYATLRVGNNDQVYRMNGRLLESHGGNPQMVQHVGEIHAYLKQCLAGADVGRTQPDRSEMDPIVIHCFSGLPWKYALIAYDGVRGYEAEQAGKKAITAADMLTAREVAFAPPRLRAYHEWEMGKELNEIILMK
ncbi:MAG: biopolymer transporter ExbD [Planctomycetota bacterium]